MTAKERAAKIRMVLMDVDGTLTDGTIIVLPDGEEIKAYNVRDGLGILLAREAGLKCGLITGKTSNALLKRAERLKISEVYQGILDKKKIFLQILEKHNLRPEEVAFIGDDIADLEVIREAGLAGAPADAHPEIQRHCHFLCRTPGGKGAVREFIEFILRSQGKWESLKENLVCLFDKAP